MANLSKEKRQSELLPPHLTSNGNGGRFLREVSARELYEFTGHSLGVASDRLRNVLGAGVDWYVNASLSQRVKALGVATAITLGGVGAANIVNREPMSEGAQIVFLSQQGIDDGNVDPMKQFSLIESALAGSIQPKARELYELSLTDTKEGAEAKRILIEGFDGAIVAGDIASSGVDFDKDLNALAHVGLGAGAALKAGLLPDNYLNIENREQRLGILAKTAEQLRAVSAELIQSPNQTRSTPQPKFDR